MAVMDEFKEERATIKNASFKKKLEYFWEYNKLWVIIGAAVIAFVGGYIYTVVTEPKTVLSGLLLNTFSVEDVTSEVEEDFCEEYGIDTSDSKIILNTTLAYSVDGKTGISTTNNDTRQVILAKAGSGQLDFMTGDLEAMTDLAYSCLFLDLREVLSEEQAEKYEPYFLYVDKSILDMIDNTPAGVDPTEEIVIPNCAEPETMEDPIPVFINLSECEKLDTAYDYDVDTLVIGVAGGLPNEENTVNFIEYLMD